MVHASCASSGSAGGSDFGEVFDDRRKKEKYYDMRYFEDNIALPKYKNGGEPLEQHQWYEASSSTGQDSWRDIYKSYKVEVDTLGAGSYGICHKAHSIATS